MREVHRIQSSPRPKTLLSPNRRDNESAGLFNYASTFLENDRFSDSPLNNPLRRLGRTETGGPRGGGGSGNTKFLQTLPAGKVVEIRDMISQATESEFNSLPSK